MGAVFGALLSNRAFSTPIGTRLRNGGEFSGEAATAELVQAIPANPHAGAPTAQEIIGKAENLCGASKRVAPRDSLRTL